MSNNNHLQILEKTGLEVEIGQTKQLVEYTVVKEMNPSVIRCIVLQ